MSIESKSTSEREAQTGTFMVEADHPGNMCRIRMARQVQLLLDLNPTDLPTNPDFQEIHPLAEPGDLVTFVHSYQGYLESAVIDEQMRAKAVAIERYETEFRDVIAATDLSRENRFSAGTSTLAHVITVDGQRYVVRSIGEQDDVREVDKHFAASVLVQDLDHIEHITAISYRDGRTVAPIVPGKNFRTLTLKDLRAISKEQIADLYDTMSTANQRGVWFDGLGDNLIYDPEHGFTAIDMSATQDDVHADLATTLQRIIDAQIFHWLDKKMKGRSEA